MNPPRRATPDDFAAIAALWNDAYPNWRVTEAEIVRDEETIEPEKRPVHWLLDEPSGFVAYGLAQHDLGAYDPRRWTVVVVVPPALRGQGLGRGMFDHIEAWVRSEGADDCTTRVAASDERSVLFAKSRGFVEQKRDFESVLDLAMRPKNPFAHPEGVRIVPWAQCDTPANRLELHRVFELVRVDIPRASPPVPLTHEFFCEQVIGDPAFDPATSHVAWEGDQIVGVCWGFVSDVPGRFEQGLTAVVRERRGRGLARAMKRIAIEAAAQRGYQSIVTDNDTRNEGMLALNDSLGFHRMSALISMRKTYQP